MIDGEQHLFVLDTNVLLHDPAALYRFHEHDIYLPMVVLEELDAAKKGFTEVARNARQASLFLDEIVGSADAGAIEAGLPINNFAEVHEDSRGYGHLFLQTHNFDGETEQTIPAPLPASKIDNNILGVALALQRTEDPRKVLLVSKDINLRIKARVLGITTDDYYDDKILDDIDLLYSGETPLPPDFQPSAENSLVSDETCYALVGKATPPPYPNECLYQEQTGFEALVSNVIEDRVELRVATDYRNSNKQVWGLTARNREQNFALNLLMDPRIEFVTLLGTAGTGKTLLTLAAGLQQTMDVRRYREIVMTRATIPVADDIGFLPGTEEEKMTPWMGALLDNLEVLTQVEVGGEWGRGATNDLLQKRIKIRSLNFMRGRTFLNRFVIIDEAQNLTPKQMKTLITRAGPGTKLVCLGNIAQIDSPYLSETSSGLTYVVDRFKSWDASGHIVLQRGERSALADYASEHL